jgi:hypothetical protein
MFGQIFEVFLSTILNHKLHSQLLESCVDIDPSQHIKKKPELWIIKMHPRDPHPINNAFSKTDIC